MVAAIIFGGVGIALLVRDTDDRATADPEPGTGVAEALARTIPAGAPFAGLTATNLGVGDDCLRVLVADTSEERSQGLREVTDLGGYDGMLFVYDTDLEAAFTMSRTPLPLDITFYAADGTPVSSTRMTPCPDGTDATCPTYASGGRFRYALETEAGSGASGAPIGSCPA